VTGALTSGRRAMIALRSEAMQLRLERAEWPAPAVALWELVGEQQRQTAMALLAALIAQVVVPGSVSDDELASFPGACEAGGRVD